MKTIKFSLLAVAAFASASPMAAEIYNKDGNKLDLYGSMRARHYFSGDTTVDGDNSYVRFGFKGQTRITDLLTGYGQWEYNVQANHSEAEGTEGNKTRFGFAGLQYGDWGSIDYGRNGGVLYDVSSITDYAPIFDIMTDSYTDGFMTGRSGGLLTYRNTNFFGLLDNLKFALQYQGKNGEGTSTSGRSVYAENGDGAGMSASYSFDWGGTILAAYGNSRRTSAHPHSKPSPTVMASVLKCGLPDLSTAPASSMLLSNMHRVIISLRSEALVMPIKAKTLKPTVVMSLPTV